jgi:hypothetical protein
MSTTAIRERPILFAGEMVRAILSGAKTQTRRIIKPQPEQKPNGGFRWGKIGGERIPNGPRFCSGGSAVSITDMIGGYCPYGQPGDRLWVRETFALEHWDHEYGDTPPIRPGLPYKIEGDEDGGEYWLIPHYRATDPDPHLTSLDADEMDDRTRWVPSIHMPRWASRLSLELTAVRVERVQEISHKDALAEGVEYDVSKPDGAPLARFRKLWDEVNGKGAWDRNDWVWVLEFKRVATG